MQFHHAKVNCTNNTNVDNDYFTTDFAGVKQTCAAGGKVA